MGLDISLKMLPIVVGFVVGGKLALKPLSPLQEVAGIALGILATCLLTTLFPRKAPATILSGPLPQTPPSAREMSKGKRFFLALGVLSLVWFQDFFLHQPKWLFFLVPLFLAVWLLFFLEKGSRDFQMESRKPGDPLQWDRRHVAVIWLVGALFLFYRLQSYPDWLSNDGQADLRTAVSVSQGTFYHLFCTEAGDNPTLAFLLFGIGMKLFGISVFSAALASAAVNWLVLPLYYGFARFFVPSSTAFMAGVLLASSHWTCFFIRTPREVSIVPAVTILALYFFAKALHTGARRDYAWLGIAMVLCMHLYLPGKAVLLFILASLLIIALFRAKDLVHARSLWLLAGAVFVLWMIPLGIWYFHHFGTLVNRSNELSIFSRAPAEAAVFLKNNLADAMRMFNVRGMEDARFNLPGMQMLDPLAGTFLWVGLAWCTLRLRRFPALLLVLGFWITLAGILFSRGGPHPMRSIVNAPFCMLLAAWGADRVIRAASALFQSRAVFLRRLLVLFFLAFVVGWNYHVYFNLTARSQAVYESCEGRALLLENYLREHSRGLDYYQAVRACYSSHCFLFGDEYSFTFESLPLKRAPQEKAAIALEAPLGWTLRDKIAHYYPLARHEVLTTPFGEPAFEVWEITPEEIQKALTLAPYPEPVGARFFSKEGGRLGSRALPAIRELWFFLDRPPSGTVSFDLAASIRVDKKSDLSLEGVGAISVSVNGLPVTQVSSSRLHRVAFQLEPGLSRLQASLAPSDRRLNLMQMNLDEYQEGKWEPLSLRAYRKLKGDSD